MIPEYELIQDSQSLALSTTEVNEHLKESITDISADTYMTLLVKAVTKCAEKYTNREFIHKKYRAYFDLWQSEYELRRSKLISVISVIYIDEDGTYQTVSNSDYYITYSNRYAKLVFEDTFDYPALYNKYQVILITFKAGYGNTSSQIPEDLRLGMLNHLARLWKNRGDCPKDISDLDNWVLQNLPTASRLIYSQYRIIEFEL